MGNGRKENGNEEEERRGEEKGGGSGGAKDHPRRGDIPQWLGEAEVRMTDLELPYSNYLY